MCCLQYSTCWCLWKCCGSGYIRTSLLRDHDGDVPGVPYLDIPDQHSVPELDGQCCVCVLSSPLCNNRFPLVLLFVLTYVFYELSTWSSCFEIYGFLFSFDIYIYHHPQAWLLSDTLHCLILTLVIHLFWSLIVLQIDFFYLLCSLFSDHISCSWCIIFHITKTNICRLDGR